MAYTEFDRTQPDGSTDNGAAFATDLLNNQAALWHAIIAGKAKGWTLSVSGGTAEEPSIHLWSNGTLRVRATYTWTSGYATSILWEYSSNSGSSYDTIATETRTYDGSKNSTAGNHSGFTSWLFEWIGKLKDLRTLYTATAATVAALGSIATQAASAVAITGGTIKGTSLGGTGANEAALATVLAAHEKYVDLGSITGGGTATIDCAACGHVRIAPAGTLTIAFSNIPASGFSVNKIIECVNFAGKTINWPGGASWGSAGAPTFTANTDFVQAISRDGGSTWRLIYGSPG